MKKLTALILLLALALCGCGGEEIPAETTAAAATTQPVTEAPTTEPTTVPTEPVYLNPLTGEQIEEPFGGRIYAVSVSNLHDAMPHVGLQQADMVFEMFVNGSVIRDLALFTDPSVQPKIGPVRSTRFIFTQLGMCYDFVMCHAGGTRVVREDQREKGLDNFSVDVSDDSPYAFRDRDRFRTGYTWDACLFAKGDGLEQHALEQGIEITGDPSKDYGMQFAEDGTPQEGEIADAVHITITHRSGMGVSKKETHMLYRPDLHRYVYNQYGKEMVDGITGEPESFQNVLVLLGDIRMNQWGFQILNLEQGGPGYYACGGKLIPIIWKSENGTSPLQFYKEDGTPLILGQGNSYIAITQAESEISWEQAEPAPEETAQAETTVSDGGEAFLSADDDYLS